MQSAQSYARSYPPPDPRSYNVLLVEDEGLIARDIAQRLEALGHTVSAIVSTGEEAVEAATGADIVLMDIRLDGRVDGIEAAQAIRERFQIPVIFLTAHADRSMVERAKQTEPFGYIVKPVAPAALHTSIEIAVHKHAVERERTERETWLRAVLVSVADAVAVADVAGRIRIMNPAAESLTGWTEAEARGQELAKIVPLASRRIDPQEGPVPLAMLRDAAVALDREAQLMTREGRLIPVEGTVAPIRLGPARGGNDAIGAVLTFRDVSRRRWEEQQIRQAQKVEAAARLSAGVAEEYATLLAVIHGQAQRLLDQFGDYSPARQAAEEIRQAASAAEQITRKLAGFGKRQPARLEVLSPNGVLRRVARLLETIAGPDVKVTVRPGLHAGKVRADPGQLEQLLMNLTTHAGQRSASGGEVRIETGTASSVLGRGPGGSPIGNPEGDLESSPEDYVRIAVSYSPASLPPILYPDGAPTGGLPFDPASIEDESLALAVAHNIVREHGGFLSAQHMETGVGGDATGGSACLEVLLPRWTEPIQAPTMAMPTSTHTILLVEPREIVRAELHKFFETNGLDLLEAADASEAIALAEVRDGPLDLVIALASEAGRIHKALEETRPGVAMLQIVDAPEQSPVELRRSYTQVILLERVRMLLETRPNDLATAAGGT